MLDGPFPLIARSNDFLLPNVLPQHQQQIPAFEFVAQIQIAFCPHDMKIAHGLIEIRQCQGAANHGHHRQIARAAHVFRMPALLRRDFQRIGKNVDRIEPDLFRELDSAGRID